MTGDSGVGLSLRREGRSLAPDRMSRPEPKPQPHPGVAGLAIASMGLVLALVLDRLGVLATMDRGVALWARGFGLEGTTRVLESWIPWTWAVAMTVGLCQAVLHVRGTWRRVMLTMTLLILTLTWIPVLALAAFEPEVSGSLLALLWGGVGSLIYAARHREPD